MNYIPMSEARDKLSDIINRVFYGNERLHIKSHKKSVVIISEEELAYFEKLEEEEEYRIIQEGRKEIERGETYTHEEMKKIWGI